MLNGIAFKGMNTEPMALRSLKNPMSFVFIPFFSIRLTVVGEVMPLTLMKDLGENKEDYVIDHLHKLEI